MKKLLIIVLLGLALPGCGNLSPQNESRRSQRINNSQGKIDAIKDEMHNLQGSINTELGNIRSDNKITAEKLDNLQQGVIVSRKDNTGVQILQGDGVLVLLLALGVLATVGVLGVLYYKDKTQKAEKVNQVLADEIAAANNPELEDRVFMAAHHAGLQKEILAPIVAAQKKFGVK